MHMRRMQKLHSGHKSISIPSKDLRERATGRLPLYPPSGIIP